MFPYLFAKDENPSAQKETKCYICIETIVPSIGSRIKTMKILVRVFCSTDILKYESDGYRGTRTDILSDLLVERIVSSDFSSSIGKVNLTNVGIYQPTANYYGRELMFEVPDFYNYR